MTDRDRIVIIGGGHNGLVCAAYLARAGREVVVLEAAAAGRRRRRHARVRAGLPRLRLRASLVPARPGHRARARARRARPEVGARGAGDGRAFAGRRPPRLQGRPARDGTLSESDRKGLADLPRAHAEVRAHASRSSTTACPRASAAAGAPTSWARPRSASTSACSAATTCASSCASPASTSTTCSRRTSSRRCSRARSRSTPCSARTSGRARTTPCSPCCTASPARRRATPGSRSPRAAWARSARRWPPRPAPPAPRSAPRARSSASRSRATASPASSSRAARRSPQATVVSNADPTRTLLGLLGARHLETGFVHRVRQFRNKGMAAKLHLALEALPAFTRLSSELAGERLVIAPDLDVPRARLRRREVRPVLAGARAGDHDPVARRQVARPAGQARALGHRAVRALRRARERRRRAPRTARARARHARPPCAGPAPPGRGVGAAAARGHRARVPHHRRPLAPRRARARPVHDAAAGARARRSTRCPSPACSCAAPAATRAAASWAPPGATRRTRSSLRGERHEHQGRDGPQGALPQGGLGNALPPAHRGAQHAERVASLEGLHDRRAYFDEAARVRRDPQRLLGVRPHADDQAPDHGAGRARLPEPPRHARRREAEARPGRLLRLVRRQRPGDRRRHDLPPARGRVPPLLAGAPARLADALGLRLRRHASSRTRTTSPPSRCRARRAARC